MSFIRTFRKKQFSDKVIVKNMCFLSNLLGKESWVLYVIVKKHNSYSSSRPQSTNYNQTKNKSYVTKNSIGINHLLYRYESLIIYLCHNNFSIETTAFKKVCTYVQKLLIFCHISQAYAQNLTTIFIGGKIASSNVCRWYTQNCGLQKSPYSRSFSSNRPMTFNRKLKAND